MKTLLICRTKQIYPLTSVIYTCRYLFHTSIQTKMLDFAKNISAPSDHTLVYFLSPPPNSEFKIPPNPPPPPNPSCASFLFAKTDRGVLTGTSPLSNLFLRS